MNVLVLAVASRWAWRAGIGPSPPGDVQCIAPGQNNKRAGLRHNLVPPRLPELLVKPRFSEIDGGHHGAKLQYLWMVLFQPGAEVGKPNVLGADIGMVCALPLMAQLSNGAFAFCLCHCRLDASGSPEGWICYEKQPQPLGETLRERGVQVLTRRSVWQQDRRWKTAHECIDIS